MKKAILIGGTSGIGNSLLKILQENEWEVHVISRNAGEHVS